MALLQFMLQIPGEIRVFDLCHMALFSNYLSLYIAHIQLMDV